MALAHFRRPLSSTASGSLVILATTDQMLRGLCAPSARAFTAVAMASNSSKAAPGPRIQQLKRLVKDGSGVGLPTPVAAATPTTKRLVCPHRIWPLVRWKTTKSTLSCAGSPSITSTSKTAATSHDQPAASIPNEQRMLIGFTCKVCNHRQYKTMSKNAYERGVVLMQCDGCKSRHLIADNKGWFRDKSVNIEELMAERGEDIRKLMDLGLLDNIEAGQAHKALADYDDIVARRNSGPK
ncbi:hypothetical protein GGH92_008285 [Coemansia sp. RSA 2673]|nr:hypothetical protein GGH92_008285 [Coemansia sp. RSA 2673]